MLFFMIIIKFTKFIFIKCFYSFTLDVRQQLKNFNNESGWYACCAIPYIKLYSPLCLDYNHLKYAVIGVTSFGSNSTPETIPDASARITTEVKKWIKQIAKNAQDSGC